MSVSMSRRRRRSTCRTRSAERFPECDPADESRPTCDDPFDSGSRAYVDPNQPVSVYTAEGALARAGWARERFVTLLLLGFAVLR